ncbi:MAG: LacI family transcriptional regulator [Clostridium sp.]|nr:LacI family transcriptional regulator [Clostridium sp.]
MKNKSHMTVKDVAEKAGVSASTVSRVLSNSSKISEKTKAKVHRIMDEMGYYPNAMARSLASNKTGNIGVILPKRAEDSFLNPFFPEAIRGILNGAEQFSYDVLISAVNRDKNELNKLKELIKSSKVDGIILMESEEEDESQKYLLDNEFPFSVIGTPYKNKEKINYVDNDNIKACYELTKHLYGTGRRKIALIAGDESITVTKKRILGYKKALLDLNLNFDEKLLFTGSFTEETGYKYAKEILRLKEIPDAIIITDDLIAFGAVKMLISLGIKIPSDISIASFNNSILSRYSDIPLTSVDINTYKLGFESVKLVVDDIEKNRKGIKNTVPFSINKRESTKIDS